MANDRISESMFITAIVQCLICTFGLVLNAFLAIVIIKNKKLRFYCCGFFLMILAIYDSIAEFFLVFLSTPLTIFQITIPLLKCFWLDFYCVYAQNNAQLLMCSISIDRLISILFPVSYKKICSEHKFKYIGAFLIPPAIYVSYLVILFYNYSIANADKPVYCMPSDYVDAMATTIMYNVLMYSNLVMIAVYSLIWILLKAKDLVRTIYSGCAFGTFSLGMVFNIFLLWLILKKTPAPMLIYSKLLMAPCIMDLFIALITFLVQPIPIVDHGFHAVIQNGFFRTTSSIYNYSANVLWFQMLLLFLCCTTIQFIFRYYMIINGELSTKLKYFTGFVIAILLVAHILLHFWSDYPYEEYTKLMEELSEKVKEEMGITEIRFSSFTPARSYQWILHCAAMISIFAICYCIIIFCFLGTRRYIQKSYGNFMVNGMVLANVRKNLRMQEYNNQVTTALIVQAFLPTVEVIELSLQTTLPIFFPTANIVHFMVFAAIPLYFIPVLNPLATMLLVKPYRRALLKMVGIDTKRRIKAIECNNNKERIQTSSTPIEVPKAVPII